MLKGLADNSIGVGVFATAVGVKVRIPNECLQIAILIHTNGALGF